jgi:hypothetical protein
MTIRSLLPADRRAGWPVRQCCDICGEPAEWSFTEGNLQEMVIRRFCAAHAEEYLLSENDGADLGG